ncbi:MAG: histidine kinase [Bacteroidales bacterium]|nr:histidine kinase [Bacteroidales bacterium]
MNAIKRFIKAVPLWAFLLVLLAVTVNTLYFVYMYQTSVDGQSNRRINGKSVISRVAPGGAADNAGMLPGDTLVTVDGMDVHEWSDIFHDVRAGDTCYYGVIRDGKTLELPVVFTSPITFFYGFSVTFFVCLVLISISSLYIIFKKPCDPAVRIFFIYIQAFAICQNATYLNFADPVAIAATSFFWLATCIFGPLLIHFHLVFPAKARIISRLRIVPWLFYAAGTVFFIICQVAYMKMIHGKYFLSDFYPIKQNTLTWLTGTYFLAVVIVIYQYITIKDTLSRNQLRLVITGSFFGVYTAVLLVFFPGFVMHISAGYPFAIIIAQGIGGMIMIAFILIALFRYRIWDINIIIRKTLQYLAAILIIVLFYLLIIFVVNQLIKKESDLVRFIALAISVVVFLVLRDRLQRWIDRLFQRESYDSATVVSDFEEEMAGVYRIEELGFRILDRMDKIFHFKTALLFLKKDGMSYEPAFVSGAENSDPGRAVVINPEFEKRLRKSKVFSPGELAHVPDIPITEQVDLIIPVIKDGRPFGFFLCGPKKSEKSYSLQDIRVLSLIAKRVVALFQTADLYQKDLDRQLALERERARISQDMHDDVGASLTRISILSELAKNDADVKDQTRQWLGQINDTSRNVMEEMSQIIWALNPKNDTLEGLAAFIRRFANEYLESTSINHTFNFPESLPAQALSIETRRNVYLVVREALHNVVKHSGATRVDIRLSMVDGRFSILIRDDGKGFDMEKLEFPGNGLVNMKKRMNDIGGEIRIKSEPGSGTEIEMDLLLNGDINP